MSELKNFGFIESELDGTEFIFGTSQENSIPEYYSYKDAMPRVIDQGAESICVPCSISAFINWRKNLENGSNNDNNVDLHEIYNIRPNKNSDGMTFKDAFKYLRHHGVATDFGISKIGTYAMVKNFVDLRYAIIENGPCVGALPVYNDGPYFWRKGRFDVLMGYHAISIVGYSQDGFIIRNSWGERFGFDGYTKLKLDEYSKLLEVWTITD